MLDIQLKRYSFREDHTKGLLFLNRKFFCHTLEDKVRIQKVHMKTAIPEGLYQIKQREEVTPLTEKYRSRFDWFDFHFQIQNVPGFNWIYLHVGNTHMDTDGCLLVGDVTRPTSIASSTEAFERLYKTMKKYNEIQIKIQNL